MGLGERKLEDDITAGNECLSPLTKKEEGTYCDKQECLITIVNKDVEKQDYNDKPGICPKLKSTNVPLTTVLVIVTILTLGIIVAAVVPRCGETSTTAAEKLIYGFPECMDDWIQYKSKCFYFSEMPDTWSNSQNFCQLHNSSLAIIDNEQELNMLNKRKGDKNYWIGLSRVKNVSGWVWTNGTAYAETIFTIESLRTASGDLEHAYLNRNGVKSENGKYVKWWICNKNLDIKLLNEHPMLMKP